MVFSDQRKRESVIAITLISFCALCSLLGFWVITEDLQREKQDAQSKLVDSFKRDKVAVIALEGIIFDTVQNRNPFKQVLNIAYVKDELKKAKEDSFTKAVLIRANSPGGTVGASQEIYQLVQEVREAGKPVVISMADICASGCYYISSAANKIVANRGTITGSIGVISQGLNFKGLFDRWGIADQTMKSGKYKDMGSGQRVMTAEERAIYQALLDSSYKQFLDDVEKSRGIPRDKLEKIAQGLIYTGVQALEVGLVDQLGTYRDSEMIVKELLKTEYGYKAADNLKFDETWSHSSVSKLQELLDFGFLGKVIANNLGGLFGSVLGSNNNSLTAADVVYSNYQPMWISQ